MSAQDNLNRAQFVYASPQRQQEIRDAVTPLLPVSKSAKTNARNEGVIRALTFSGVPAEHLQGMTGISYKRSNYNDARYSRSEERSTHRVVGASLQMDLPVADALRSGDRMSRRVVVHEVGHHVHAQNDHDSYFSNSPGRSGYSEAIAENYADKNARAAPSVYDQIVNAKPGELGHADQRRWGTSNVAAYQKHRGLGTQPDNRGK